MKIYFGETHLEKVERLSKPHKWFAWYPVEISAHDYRWLEYVERTGKPSAYCDGLWFWRYKAIPKTVGGLIEKDKFWNCGVCGRQYMHKSRLIDDGCPICHTDLWSEK